ncbi:MAG TPA: C40 family peptidase [Steroidobacter sp.]|nr:C40 family peptidase [Steroidobacteraceae bacterium]HLS82886.1 C40 family peptidase [Steroidobacter sp.]
MKNSTARLLWAACLLCGVLLQGCSTTLVRPPPLDGAPPALTGNEIALRAMALLGTPYRYGGDTPAGFDCSGLVSYVHRQLGIATPRTAAQQFAAAQRIPLDELAPGDLLFFRIGGRRVSHVAIYTGEGRFIHAPQTGRSVELRPLDDEFYRPRMVGAGRFEADSG